MNIIKVRQDTVGTRTKLVKLVQIELVQSFQAIGLGHMYYVHNAGGRGWRELCEGLGSCGGG